MHEHILKSLRLGYRGDKQAQGILMLISDIVGVLGTDKTLSSNLREFAESESEWRRQLLRNGEKTK